MTRARYTDAEKKTILRQMVIDYEGGMTFDDMARRYNMAQATARAWGKLAGIVPRATGRRPGQRNHRPSVMDH